MRGKAVITSILASWILMSSNVQAAPEMFSTWDGFEVDKLASIWLIKRFVSPGASIVIYPKGDIIKEGIEFDTPFSDISRKSNQSTFEVLLGYYQITDRKLINIGKLIHDIEINTWERKVFSRSAGIEIQFIDIISENKGNDEVIKRSVQFLNSLYNEIPVELERN